MNYHKPTITACILAISAPIINLNAQIELTDSAAISGFVNGIYSHTDREGQSQEHLRLDEVEMDLIFNLDTVSGEVHLHSIDGGNVELEQAFTTIDFGNGVSVTAGRFLSLLGFESDESVNRFTRTRAYDLSRPIPLYAEGINAKGVNDLGWISMSVLDEVWDGFGGGEFGNGSVGVEFQGGFTTQNGFTAVIGYAGQKANGNYVKDPTKPLPNAELLNVWVSYETGPFIFAAEYNDFSNAAHANYSGDADYARDRDRDRPGEGVGKLSEGESYMFLAHYAIDNNLSITARYSEEELDNGDGSEKWTISPKYSFTDNLAGRIEYSRTDLEENGTTEEVDFISVEAMFTF